MTLSKSPENLIIYESNIELSYDWRKGDDPKSFIDLDSMEIGESKESDLLFNVGGGTDLFVTLYPLNGALALSMGTEEISLSYCRDISDSFEKYSIPDVFVGNHICVLSNKSHIFLLRIEDLKSIGSADILYLSITYSN